MPGSLAAVIVGVAAPDLTRLTAESEALLLDKSAESARAEAIIKQSWPDQSYESMAVVALHRASGLTPADHDYAARLADAFAAPDRPKDIVRVLGPKSDPRVAERLVSADRTTQLVVAELTTAFVSPTAAEIVAWLQKKAAALPPPAGLELKWTGDAVIGRDYMADVQTSLDRAALATVCLLLFVLMAVYRSFWLSLVPAGDDRDQPGHLARGARVAGAGGVGDLAAGRAVPGGHPLRQRDRLLPVHLLAIRRELEPREPRRGHADDAPPRRWRPC